MSALEKENTTIFITKKKINDLAIEFKCTNCETTLFEMYYYTDLKKKY